MDENKRLLKVLGTIGLIILIILLAAFWPEPDRTFMCNVKGSKEYKKVGLVDYDQYKCLKKKGKTIGLVVADNLSKKEMSNLNNAAKAVNSGFYYLDQKSIDSDDLKQIKKDLKNNKKSFKKDVLLALSKGKVKDYKEDILDSTDDLKKYALKNHLSQFACNVKADSEFKNLGEIDYNQYKCLLKSDEPFAVIVAQTTCGFCSKFKPVIDEYVKDNNLTIYIIEIDKWSDEDKKSFNSSLDYFKKNKSWGTPLTLGIKDGKVVAELNGFTKDEKAISGFFIKAGLK